MNERRLHPFTVLRFLRKTPVSFICTGGWASGWIVPCGARCWLH